MSHQSSSSPPVSHSKILAAVAFLLIASVSLTAAALFTGGSGSFRYLGLEGSVLRYAIEAGTQTTAPQLYVEQYHDGALQKTFPLNIGDPPLTLTIDAAAISPAASDVQAGETTIRPLELLSALDDSFHGQPTGWGLMPGETVRHVTAGKRYCLAFCAYSYQQKEPLCFDSASLSAITDDPSLLNGLDGYYYVVWGCFPAADTAQTPSDDGMPLDGDRLVQLNELFSAGSWYTQALTSLYDDPRDVDLYQMFYNGGQRQVTQEEYDYVQQLLDYPGTDVLVITPQEMDQALEQVFGLSLTETHQVGLEQFLYWEDTDCYYLCHGDTNAMSVTFLQGNNQGEGCLSAEYQGYDGLYSVELRLGQTEADAGLVYIYSHTKAD